LERSWRGSHQFPATGALRVSLSSTNLEQFAVDPRCSPKRVRDAHVANELANFSRCLWPAAARPCFPAPIGCPARCQRITVRGLRILSTSNTPGTRNRERVSTDSRSRSAVLGLR
jgi:hypothetical protein